MLSNRTGGQVQKDDYLMSAIAILSGLKDTLHENQRIQISANDLAYMNQVLPIVMSANLHFYAGGITLALTKLQNIIEVIKTISQDDGFTETDNDQKNFIVKLYNEAYHDIMMYAGRYYDTMHSFTVTQSQFNLYRKVIDYNIQHGYYFGADEKFKGEN